MSCCNCSCHQPPADSEEKEYTVNVRWSGPFSVKATSEQAAKIAAEEKATELAQKGQFPWSTGDMTAEVLK